MESTLYASRIFTEPGGFPSGIEGPACDGEGNLYAVNYARRHTIGKVTPTGECELFVELPEGSSGCGIRFNRQGNMLVADHTGHHILEVDIKTRQIAVRVHEPAMNQPNDLAMADNGVLFASDPNWRDSTGQLWRIGPDNRAELLEAGMGTTNGIEISPDGRVLYVNETRQRLIWAYDLSTSMDISRKRLHARFPDYGLDGMRCDAAGNLYVTRHGKGNIAVLSPEGELIREIALHGKECTNLTFGGPDGRTCYVTVADTGNIETFRTEAAGRCWLQRQTERLV